ncbi:unnamed protein product [Toxocara canis]|uniref:DnaJ homolog dnj-20 n=1 Tax=Toxocara canis TaxID=6265 RepID=A0A183USU9_TOXCA|nr:unnamed protein product [Toxocara canis]
MPEDRNTNRTSSKLNSFFRDGAKKMSNGFQNFVNDMGHAFADDPLDVPSSSDTIGANSPGVLTFNLGVSIEEVTTGCTKKLKISRQAKIFTSNGSFYVEDAILEVPIKKGLRAGTRITFPNAGDRYPGQEPASLLVTIFDKRHQLYTRDKDDVIYKCIVPLYDAVCGCTIDVPLILGGTRQVIKPGKVYRIRGEGIPNNRSGVRGDIIVTFEIDFPKQTRPDLKEFIRQMYN